MGGHVGVGVALESLGLVRPDESGEGHRAAVDEAVHVGADADAGRARGSLHGPIMPERQSNV